MSAAESIVADNLYMNIATVCEDGSPWNTPVFFAGDLEKGLFWWSPTAATHSKNINNNSKVFITIYNSKEIEGNGSGVYIQATARLVKDEELEQAINTYNGKAKTFKLNKSVASADAPTRLYKAVPRKIWMNDAKEDDGYYQDIRKEIA